MLNNIVYGHKFYTRFVFLRFNASVVVACVVYVHILRTIRDIVRRYDAHKNFHSKTDEEEEEINSGIM